MIEAGRIGLTLPFAFEPASLKHDLAAICPDEWTPHYNESDYGGLWQGIALRSATGSYRDLHAGHPGAAGFTDTDLAARCPSLRRVMAGFRCPLNSVRLLSLAPGSFIHEHCDAGTSYEEGEVRIHVPVQTSPDVEFYVCGERLRLDEGGCYYVNVNLPHRVNNRGSEPRIHLVIDLVVNDWVRSLFGRGAEIARSALPPKGFAEFAGAVFADDALQARLNAIGDRARLLEAAVAESSRLGFVLNRADMQSAFRSAASPGREAGSGWWPAEVTMGESGPMAKWIYAPGHRFTQPFFHEDVKTCLRHPFTALFQREAPLTARPRIAPAGFIFHTSRCGSTLISRSLAAAESVHVISEAAPVDRILRTGNPNWLQHIVSALGRPGKYIVKLDAWHIYNLPLIRAVFPETPWIFVHRDLEAVVASQLRQPGLHAIPGGMNLDGVSLPEWYRRTLKGFLNEAERFRADLKGMFVAYKDLPEAICGPVAEHFGLNLSPRDEQLVQAATAFDAKNPYALFPRGV